MTRRASLIIYLTLLVLAANSCRLNVLKTPPDGSVIQKTDPVSTLSPEPEEAAGTGQPVELEIEADFWDLFRDGLIHEEQSVLNELPGASEYVLELSLSDDYSSLTGRQTVLYTNREDTVLDEVYFRLFANTAGGSSQVSNVTVDGVAVQPRYEYERSAIRLPLAAPLPIGRTIEIGLDFQVSIPRQMGGNYGLFGFFEGVLVLDEFYPVIPVYDEEGWNVESPPPNADLPYYDASFYQVTIAAPSAIFLAASGVETARAESADRQVVTFAAGPARGFYIAGSDQFTRSSLIVGETLVNCYAGPGQFQAVGRSLEAAEGALSFFGEYLGTFPYTELDIVSTPMLALGMEYPGLTAISSQLFSNPERIMVLESTVAHEIAHQWFFNVVGNDQVDHPWLDEAVVQYLTYRYFLDSRGAEAAQVLLDNWHSRWERVDNENIPIGLPAREYSAAEYSAIVYGRGPIFIKTLAEKMGVETFDTFLREYARQNWWGTGTPQEFVQLAEEYCSCDLTSLFDEWVNPYQSGLPNAGGSLCTPQAEKFALNGFLAKYWNQPVLSGYG
jgi:hypothetical protein